MFDVNKHEDRKYLGISNYSEMKSTRVTSNTNESKTSYIDSWDNQTLKPQTMINYDNRNTLVAQYDASRQDVVQKIVQEAQRNYNPPPSNTVYNINETKSTQDYQNLLFHDKKADRIHTNVESLHNVDHKHILHEIHYVERPVEVRSMEQIQRYWEARHLVLLRQKQHLEDLIKRGLIYGKHEQRVIPIVDNFKIKELEEKIQALKDKLALLDKAIEELEDQLNDLEDQQAEAENSDENNKMAEKIAAMKKQFSDLNNDVSQKNEDIAMAEAEIDTLKNRKVTASVTKSKAVVSGGGGGTSGSQRQSQIYPK